MYFTQFISYEINCSHSFEQMLQLYFYMYIQFYLKLELQLI